MSEPEGPSSPPSGPPPVPPPAPAGGGWWIAWILSVLVLPPVAVFLGLSNGGKISQGFAVALGLSAVLLHLLSCSQLAPKGCMFHVLFFGGYALLLLVLFFGCAMNAPY